MKLKENLRKLIESRGTTASKLGRVAGVPKQSISEWMSGSMPKDLRKVKKVAEALETTIDVLCFGNPESKFDGAERSIDLESMLTDSWVSGVFEV